MTNTQTLLNLVSSINTVSEVDRAVDVNIYEEAGSVYMIELIINNKVFEFKTIEAATVKAQETLEFRLG